MIKSKFNKLYAKYKDAPLSLKAGLWFTACNFMQKAISFITIPIFTRIMTTEAYGNYSVYTSWYSIITIFATLNLHTFVFSKGMVKYSNDRDSFTLSLQGLSTVVTIAVFAICMVLSSGLHLIELSPNMMFCMLLLLLFEPPILLWSARQRFEYKYVAVVFVTLAISLLNPLIGILFVRVFDDAAFARAISVSLVAVIFGIYFYIRIALKGKKVFEIKYWKYALLFNIPLIPHYLSTTILNQADRIMISSMDSAAKAGIYSVAYAVSVIPVMLNTAVQQSFLPWLYTKLSKKDYNQISNVTNAILVMIVAFILLLTSFAPEVIKIVGTKEYYDAIWIVPPVCGSVLFVAIQNMFANIEYYFEETKYIAIASVGVAVSNILLNYIFIKLYGFIAAGYTTLVCYIAYAIAHYFILKFICKKHSFSEKIFDMRFIVLMSICSLALMIVMTLLYNTIIARYALIAGLFIALIIFRKKIIGIFKMLKQ